METPESPLPLPVTGEVSSAVQPRESEVRLFILGRLRLYLIVGSNILFLPLSALSVLHILLSLGS